MKRARIIYALVLISVFAAFGAVYQFYFKEQLAKYARDEAERQKLEAAFQDIHTTFQGAQPEELTRLWRANVQPWSDAVAERSARFNIQEWYEHEQYPADGKSILKFWFDEQVNRQFQELYQQVQETSGLYRFPQREQLRLMLGIPTIDEIENMDLPQSEAYRLLRRLSFLQHMVDYLLDAKISGLNEIVLWPKRQLEEHGKLLELQTIGVDFTTTAKDLINFVDNQLRTADRFFTIDGLKVSYPYVAHNQEPQLQVQMLMTVADFKPRTTAEGATAAVAGAGATPQATQQAMFGNRLSSRPPAPPVEEPGMFAKGWKWFKRTVLYMN